jgi:hypothetical protein
LAGPSSTSTNTRQDDRQTSNRGSAQKGAAFGHPIAFVGVVH